jgi:phosphate transport system substrate-binding protein
MVTKTKTARRRQPVMKILPVLLAASLTFAAHAQEPLRIEGSNTFGEKLGPLLVKDFKKSNPGIPVELKRPGSGPGLASLIAGRAAIAPTSRPADRTELLAAKKAGVKLRPQLIGSYGVAVIVNEANPVKNFKPSQVRSLFNGKITNWSKLRGSDQPVNLYILDKNTGARAGFQELAMRGDEYAVSAKPMRDYAAVIAAVAKDPSGIGYADMGPLPPGVRAALINGEPPNSVAIYEQVYPYANSLYLYTLERKTTPAARKFILYALSKDGQRIIQKAGFVPRLAAPPGAMTSIAP